MAGLFANFRLQACSKLSFFSRKKGIDASGQAQQCLGRVLAGAVQGFTAKPRGMGKGTSPPC